MTRFIILAALVGVLATSPTDAGSKNGNELYDECKDDGPYWNQGVCHGYIIGITDAVLDFQDANVLVDNFQKVCMPTEVTTGQIVENAKKYLNDNPEERNYPGSANVVEALLLAFPCKK